MNKETEKKVEEFDVEFSEGGIDVNVDVKKYDERENLVYCKIAGNHGFQERWKFDKRNNKIGYEGSCGEKFVAEYDENNNKMYFKNSDGEEYWKVYDENNNCIHFQDSTGYKEWKEYDKNNNCIHFQNSRGNNLFYEYNKSGKRIKITEANRDIQTMIVY